MSRSGTSFQALTEALETATRMRGRTERVHLLGALLRQLDADEVAPAIHLMLGRGAGVKSGISWAGLMSAARQAFDAGEVLVSADEDGYVDAGEYIRRLSARADHPLEANPTVLDVHRTFLEIAESKGRNERVRLLADLLRGAPPGEAAWIARNATGEMRTGVQEGLLLDAIAWAANQSTATVRRALVAAGDIATLAQTALVGGGEALADASVRIGQPIPVMLAGAADDLDNAMAQMAGRMALEWKLDGARVQIHKQGERVWLWSRRMTDVSARLPDVVDLVRRSLAAQSAIVEGEVIVLGADGRPIPFQDVMRRWLRTTETESAAARTPASVFLFDCLHANGETMIDEPYVRRWATLERVRGSIPTMPRLVVAADQDARAPAAARAFYEEAIAAGHEGLMAKSLESPYAPGRRGSHWLKIKAQTSLDLVVIGADWGTGRRHRWLSNYHLGCRDAATGAFLSVGETFKGLTDKEFAWMTERLRGLTRSDEGGYVSVKPEVVVEVAFNGVQRSTRLPSGVALRFARITRIRDDKRAQEADTLEDVRRLLA